MSPATPEPLRYDPSFERPEPEEAETDEALTATMRGISETTAKDYGHAVRSVHAKSHGILTGELRVTDGLPPELAQGLFARTGSYPVVLRFSTNPGDILNDSINIGLPRGLAIKVAGVEGERLPGSEGQATQDLVMVDSPAFGAPNGKAFLGSLKMLAATTDIPQGLKTAAVFLARGAEAVVEAVGLQSPTLTQMGGHPHTHPIGATYYTQVPVLYGPYMAKLSVAPVSPGLVALTDAAIRVDGRADALREEIASVFRNEGGEWEIRVQLCTDREKMPIEDASVAWPEELSPYRAVARIRVEAQQSWGDARSDRLDQALSFSPWHGLAAHRPIGSIMRLRRRAYEMSAGFRATVNRCPIHEPRGAADLS